MTAKVNHFETCRSKQISALTDSVPFERRGPGNATRRMAQYRGILQDNHEDS